MTYETLEMYIDGRWCRGSEGRSETVVNPATEQPLAELPHASHADLDRALEAADRGFKLWSRTSAHDRATILKKAAGIMRERADHIAATLTMEEGKIIAEGRGETLVSADILEWYANEAMRTYGRVIPSRAAGVRHMVQREPIGPAAAFTPWNFPALTPARKIGGALAAGCSLIIKASEETPGTCVAMMRALEEAGLPPGVMSLVFGVPAEISEYLIPHPVIRKVSFTGSTAVGKHLAKMAAEGMKPVTMELGGHAPVIVCDDVDVAKVVKMSVAGKFRNAGQVCIAPTRFFVHDRVYKSFVDGFTEAAAAIRLGDGLDPETQMGPLANDRRLEAMDAFVNDAVEHGAELRTGGEREGNQGYFYRPTVLADVPFAARIMRDEPFGPLAPMTRFTDFDEVIEHANALPYGLAAYAFTGSRNRAEALQNRLESGMVGLNSFNISLPETPFGGVKESGYGREGGVEGLEAYMITKFISQSEA